MIVPIEDMQEEVTKKNTEKAQDMVVIEENTLRLQRMARQAKIP